MIDIKEKVYKLMNNAGFSFLGSISKEGFPNIKAMLKPRKIVDLDTIYFSTNTSSMRVAQYEKNPKACVYFYDGLTFQGVMLEGNMEVFHDSYHKEMLWEEGDTLYYPKGVTDEDYCVLKFTVLNGRYYGNFKSEDFGVE